MSDPMVCPKEKHHVSSQTTGHAQQNSHIISFNFHDASEEGSIINVIPTQPVSVKRTFSQKVSLLHLCPPTCFSTAASVTFTQYMSS